MIPLLLLFTECGDKKPESTNAYSVASDVPWAAPEGFELKMDIYTPNGDQASYPVIVMFHGGGWLINNKSIMNDASAYLATNSRYVICNVDYRLLTDQKNTVTMNEIIEDVMGAVLWVKQHIAQFKGDPSRIIVTGDSAGGHLASIILTQGHNLETDGFDGPTLGYHPSWLPEGKTVEDVANENGLAVQAAMLSYGAFDIHAAAAGGFESSENIFWTMSDGDARGIFGDEYNVTDHPDRYQQVSPIYTIPPDSIQSLPPILLTVGSEDNLVTPESIQNFMNTLNEKGHNNTEYWVHEGRPHAFLDSGRNLFLGINFEDDAIPALQVMIQWLDQQFYM